MGNTVGTVLMATPVMGWRLRFTYRQLVWMCGIQLLAVLGFYAAVSESIQTVAKHVTSISTQHGVTQSDFDFWKSQLTNRTRALEQKIDTQ